MKSHNALIISTLLWAIAMALVAHLWPNLTDTLRLAPEQIYQGQWYRFLTGHLVHLSPTHAWLNGIALIVLVWIFREGLTAKSLFGNILMLAVLVSSLLLTASDIHWYVGFSGILHGLFVCLLMQDQSFPPFIRIAALLALAGKLGFEQVYGAAPLTNTWIGGPVLTDSHLWGALGGVIITLAKSRSQSSPNQRRRFFS